MAQKVVQLTEKQFKKAVFGICHRFISENIDDYWDWYDGVKEPEYAINDFKNSGFEQELQKRYPDMYFEFDVDNNGNVTVLDLNTGKFYTGKGEIEYETVGLGYPNPNDYDSEAEGEAFYYDFYDCLNTIMQKIDNDQPDGVDNNIIETTQENINNSIVEAVKVIREQKNS